MIPTVGVDVLVSLGDKLTAPLRDVETRIAKASERMNRRLHLSMKLAGGGAAAAGIAYGAGRLVSSFTDSIREVERAKGELATLGVRDLDAVVQRGYEMQTQLAGITADAFVRASYDIKSGISSLTDQGVADMTASAMLVAKATKGQAEQMTSLFATSYGIFKDQYAAMSDADFGSMFGAALSASVQQFKTDGAAMQQAIESAGAGAVNLGMQMTEQLTLLGMMQQQMSAGEAGTALKAFSANAAKAHEAFGKMRVSVDHPVRVRILDERGQLRAMPDILADLKARYGETLDAFEAAEIQKAFGTEEAMKMINALYGQEAAVRANAEALGNAADQGAAFTEQMARAADSNWDAAMVLLSQKMDVLHQKIGERLLPVVERLLPVIDVFMVKAFDWIDANPELVTGIGAVVAGLGAMAAIIAPILIGASALVSGWAMMSYGATRLGLAVFNVGKWVAGAGRWLFWLGRLVLPLVSKAIMFIGRALIANPIGAIVMGIAVAAYLIYKYWEPISAFFQDLWAQVVDAFTSAADWITSAVDSVIGFDWASLFTLDGLRAAWTGVIGFLSGVLATLWDGIIGIDWTSFVSLDTLKIAWETLTSWIAGVVGTLWEGIKFIAWIDYVALTALIDAWGAVTDWIVERAATLWENLVAIDWGGLINLQGIKGAWDSVTTWFADAASTIWDLIPDMPEWTFSLWGDENKIEDPETLLAAAEAASNLEARFPALTTAANDTLAAVQLAISQIMALVQGTDLTSEGARIAGSIAAGIRAQIGEVRAAAAAMSVAIRSALPGNANVNVALSGEPAPVQARASGGWYKPGWLLTGEQGPELRYASEGGFIAHNRALRGMLNMASRTRDLVSGIGFEGLGASPVPALATVAAAAGPTMQRGPITLSPQYHMPMSFERGVDMDEVRNTVRQELIAAEERAQVDLRRLLHD